MKRESSEGARCLGSATRRVYGCPVLPLILLAACAALSGDAAASVVEERAHPESDDPSKPSAPVSRSEAEMLLREADDAYLDGRFEEAASIYRVVAEGGFGTADVWFNLGNACWQDGRVGQAVVAWERALLRAPRHEDARANLRLARESLVDDVVGARPAPAMERLARRIPVATVVWGLAAVWVLGAVSLIVRRRARARRRLLGALAALCIVGVVVFGSLSAVAVWYHEAVVRAVVTVPVAPVRSGPAPRFDAAFEIHEGLVVRVIGYEGPYARVRLDNERSGWVLRRSIQTI